MVFIPKTNWANAPATTTPITATELIRIENGIVESIDQNLNQEVRLVNVESDVAAIPTTIATDISSLNSRVGVAEADILALEAKVTTKLSVGTTPPGSPSVNDLWVDTS